MCPTKFTEETGSKPLVSILIPAYNHAYFRESLESALNQTYTNTEIIVCDDSGSYRIRKIVASVIGAEGIKYRVNKRNLGARKNYLKCFRLSKGHYIKYLNDDDVLAETCIQSMVDVLEQYPDVTLVSSRRRLIDGKGTTLPDAPFTRPAVANDSIIPGLVAIQYMLGRKINFIGEPTTAMFRRKDIGETLPDIMSFGGRPVMANLDVAMWLNLLSKGDLAYLIEVMSCFRIHGQQEQQKKDVRELCMSAWHQVTLDARRMGLLTPDNREVKPLLLQSSHQSDNDRRMEV